LALLFLIWVFAESKKNNPVNKQNLAKNKIIICYYYLLDHYMKYARTISVLSLLLFLSLFFHRTELNKMPSTIHAWAQADRYAIALGFVRNGLNFFKPETYVLNHQFPGNWQVPHTESITAVDFPIHDFLPAVIMKISGRQSLWIYQLYVMLYSIAGLIFLFKLTFMISRDYLKSLFIVIFAATSPVFVYYQAGTLPTIPSLSNAIIGLYFYSVFIRTKKHTHFGFSILFLTLATLSRTTFAIPLVAIYCMEFLRIIRGRSAFVPKLVPVLASVISIMAYYLYNNYLRNIYGSDFLGNLLPADSLSTLSDFINLSLDQWSLQYFSLPQYIFFAAIIIVSLGLMLFKNHRPTSMLKILFYLAGIILVGVLIFTALMIRQFPAHDYYFLDTYFLPLILILILLISVIPPITKKSHKIIYIPLLIIGTYPLITGAYDIQKHRKSAVYQTRVGNTIDNFKGTGEVLDSLGISKQSTVLVLDAYAPNIPFIMMDRKGFAVVTTTKENIQQALEWNFDLLVYQNEFFYSDIYNNYPGIIQNLEKIHDTGLVTFCRYTDKDPDQSLLSFEGLESAEPVWANHLSFDGTTEYADWSNIKTSGIHTFSETGSAMVDSSMLYGPTLKLKDNPFFNQKKSKLYVGTMVLRTEGDCSFIVSIRQHKKNIFYKKLNINTLVKETGNWKHIELIFDIPEVVGSDFEFAFYVLNQEGGSCYFDDLSLQLF
jgi:hypothetical protein